MKSPAVRVTIPSDWQFFCVDFLAVIERCSVGSFEIDHVKTHWPNYIRPVFFGMVLLRLLRNFFAVNSDCPDNEYADSDHHE